MEEAGSGSDQEQKKKKYRFNQKGHSEEKLNYETQDERDIFNA